MGNLIAHKPTKFREDLIMSVDLPLKSLAAKPLKWHIPALFVSYFTSCYARTVGDRTIDRGFGVYVTAKCVVLEIGPFNLT